MIYLFAVIMGAIFGYIAQFIADIYIEFTTKEKNVDNNFIISDKFINNGFY